MLKLAWKLHKNCQMNICEWLTLAAIACNLACMKLLIASCCSGHDARAELKQQATELVNQILHDTLAKRDSHCGVE